MSKKVICVALALCSLRFAFPPPRSSRRRTRGIGYLSPFDPAGEPARAEGIRLGLRERGYIEGQNIATEYRYAEGSSIGPGACGRSWRVSRSSHIVAVQGE